MHPNGELTVAEQMRDNINFLHGQWQELEAELRRLAQEQQKVSQALAQTMRQMQENRDCLQRNRWALLEQQKQGQPLIVRIEGLSLLTGPGQRVRLNAGDTIRWECLRRHNAADLSGTPWFRLSDGRAGMLVLPGFFEQALAEDCFEPAEAAAAPEDAPEARSLLAELLAGLE